MIKQLLDINSWKVLLQSDFNRGYIAALLLVLALLLALLILKLLFMFMFRNRRCSVVTIRCKDGDILVSRDAVTEAVSRELGAFPDLDVRKIRLFQHRKHYRMTLFCGFGGDGGVPQLVSELKPRLLETLKNTFGIDTMESIQVVIETLNGKSEHGSHSVPPAPPVPPFSNVAGF